MNGCSESYDDVRYRQQMDRAFNEHEFRLMKGETLGQKRTRFDEPSSDTPTRKGETN